MRKLTMITTAIIAGALFLASCGGDGNGLLTQEEFDKRVEELTAEKIAEISPQMDQQCEERFEALVKTKVDSIITVATRN